MQQPVEETGMATVDIAQLNAIVARLEGVATRLEKGVGSVPNGGYPGVASANSAEDAPAIALSFDSFLRDKLPALEAACKDVGVKDVDEATEFFVSSLRLLRELLAATGAAKKPEDASWAKILAPVLELGQKAQKACDNRSDYFQNRKSAAEALNVVTLVTASSPPSHVQNVLESMDFHAIKVMQKKNDKETAWVKALKAIVKDLKDWCSEDCKLGLIWNPQGKAAADYFAAHPLGQGTAPASKGQGKGKAPPVPKGGLHGPPPEVLSKLQTETSKPAAAGMGAVFDAIKSIDTSALKKVTSEMKTKNQPRETGPISAPVAKASATRAGESSGYKKGPRGPPIKELQKGTNWMVENYDGVSDLVLDDVSMGQLVCLINCRNTTLQIKGKVKSICVDGCEKVNLICQDVVSAVEVVNCERCQVQTIGKVNSFAIDKCNGINIFLSKESLEAEFVTSKSSEMNVTIPDGDEGDIIEMPIPEQFVTRLQGKKLKTEVSSLYTS